MRLRSSLLFLAALGFTLVNAAPAELVRRDAEAESVAEGVPLRRLLARQVLSSATCNLGEAQMSVGKSSNSFCNLQSLVDTGPAPTPLPSPSNGLVLTHVAIGRGTQNYTCANSTATPVAAGAVASLFNATCLVAPFPQLLETMACIALEFPVPDSSDPNSPANLFLSGTHYFTDSTTALFNFNTTLHNWGSVACKKHSSSNAPYPSRDVPWLKLTSKSTSGSKISEVYRLNTAGGLPPTTCEGQQANIQVQYSAEYWFWAQPS
jgi:hypothetical protein